MNIIFLTWLLPYPPNSGASIYTWERLKQLKKHNCNIYLFSINRDPSANYKELYKVCKEVNVFNIASKKKRWAAGVLKFYRPYFVYINYYKEMYESIRKLINNSNIDLIIIDIPEMLINCPLDNKIPKIITQHNCENELLFSISRSSKNLIKKAVYWAEGIKLKKFEEKYYNKNVFDGYVFISQDNMEEFMSKYSVKNCICIPPGYDIKEEFFYKKNSKTIIFTGMMNYEANVQAVVWFANNIFPQIRKQIPDVKFLIIGKNPTHQVKQLGNIPGITVVGPVQDMKHYLRMASLYVIPLQSGDGVKIKLFEALGNYNIVITTSKGVEGTDFKNGQHLIISDDEVDFANQCINVLVNYDKYSHLAKNAAEFIKSNYSWDSIGSKYIKYIRNTAELA